MFQVERARRWAGNSARLMMTIAVLAHPAMAQESGSIPTDTSAGPNVLAMAQSNLLLIEARVLKQTGHLDQAIAIYRRLLDDDPSRDDVRLELADALFVQGDDMPAQHHFERLLEGSASDERAALYQRYISAIRARRPWSFEGTFGLVPSTNVNNGATNNIVFIGGIPFTPNNQAQSGIGVDYRLSGSYRHPLGDHLAVIFGASLNGDKYENEAYDSLRLRSFAELAATAGMSGFRFGATAERTLAGWQGHSFAAGPHISAHHTLPGAGTFRTRLSWMYREHDILNALDGPETEFSLSYSQILGQRFSLTVGGTWRRVDAQLAFNSYESIRPHLSLDYHLDRNLMLHGRLSYEKRTYLGPFPILGSAREDERADIGIGATFNGLAMGGLVPRIDYNYRATTSNVGLYTSDSHSLGLSVSRRY